MPLMVVLQKMNRDVKSQSCATIYAAIPKRFDSNTVEVFIARLRRKLGASFIETVRGLGYRIQ
jgi:DNA-binding response OmpR family regulator